MEYPTKMPLQTLVAEVSSTPMFWCPDCQIYVSSHPLDHLVDRHPPQHPDGSHALPERMAW